MPSPVAHSLAALAIAHLAAPAAARGRAPWYLVAVVAANAADLDFVVGLATGSINAFHGGASHSYVAAAAFGLVAALAVRVEGVSRTAVGAMAAALYASHIVLDMACEPSPRNPGMPVLWPLTDARYLFAWRPLLGILHGGSAGLDVFVDELFSAHNVKAIALEAAVFAPLLVLASVVRRSPRRREAELTAEK